MTDTLTKGNIFKDDFSFWSGGNEYTGSRKTSTGGTQSLKRIDWPGVDVYSIYGEKTLAAINSAAKGLGTANASLWLGPGEWTITDDLTLGTNVDLSLDPGATINISAGKTLTIGGHFKARPRYVFTGTGTIVFSSTSTIRSDWFGTSKNYTTLSNMLSRLGTTNHYRIKLSRGTWTIDDDLDLSTYRNLELLIPNGCLLSISNTKTLTFASSVQINATGQCQIFTGSGEISFPDAALLNVRWFGAYGDDTNDDTSGFQAAHDMVASSVNSVTVLVPAGRYELDSTFSITRSRFFLLGESKETTVLRFSPSGNDTMIAVGNGAAIVSGGGIKNLSLYSDDTANTKIALSLRDIQVYHIENVHIYGDSADTNRWEGANSIGINTKGRDNHYFLNVTIEANKPLRISDNPNSTIDIDHYNFHNLYLIGDTSNPLVTLDDGVNLTFVSFTGAQAWAKGSFGLFWSDTTTTQVSIGLFINNVRLEQGGTTDYNFYINHNQGLQQLVFNSVRMDDTRKGIYLRTVDNVGIYNCQYPDNALEAFNVDSSVGGGIIIQNCFWQAGSTATITGQRRVFGLPHNPNTGPLPPNVIYDETANTKRDIFINNAIASDVITLADAATENICTQDGKGFLVVTDQYGYVGTFILKGPNHAVAEISDPDNVYDVAAGVDTYNVYWDGATYYVLQNNSGASTNFKVMMIGSFTSF